ncbi:MAG: GNAT family N-acetyltransferase [bacterium]
MEIRKVKLPDQVWYKNLQKLALKYPFENERRQLQELNIRRHFANSLKNNKNSFFFIVLKENEPAGWIKLSKNNLHSSKLNREIYNTSWELIEANDNMIRKKLLEEIITSRPNKQLIFQQPLENKPALKVYKKLFQEAGREQLLYINPGNYKKNCPPPGEYELKPLIKIKRSELEELIYFYEGGHLLGFPGYPHDKTKKLYRDWLLHMAPRPRFYCRILSRKNRTVGIICANTLADSSPARKKCGSIAYIQVHPRYTGRGLGKVLLAAGINYLKNKGVEYIELKVNSDNTGARRFYQSQGFKAISERIYYTYLP